jgi:hypothetical protein
MSACGLTPRSKTDARKRGYARLLTPFNANVDMAFFVNEGERSLRPRRWANNES